MNIARDTGTTRHEQSQEEPKPERQAKFDASELASAIASIITGAVIIFSFWRNARAQTRR